MRKNSWVRFAAGVGILALLAGRAGNSFSVMSFASAQENSGAVQALAGTATSGTDASNQSSEAASASMAEGTEVSDAGTSDTAVTAVSAAQADAAGSASSAVASSTSASSASSSSSELISNNGMVTITYLAGEGGSVSLSQEQVDTQKQVAVQGSTAVPASGYEFTGWTDQAGRAVSSETVLVPSLTQNDDGSYVNPTYTASFSPVEAKPQFHAQMQLSGVTITLDADQGVLPAGTVMKAQEVTSQVAGKVTEEASQGDQTVTDVLAYDITLYDADGTELPDDWAENGLVHVSFSGDRITESSADADNVKILHLNDNGEVEQAVASEKLSSGDSISEIGFDASHFSVYAVTMYAQNKAGSEKINIAGTFDIYDGKELTTDLNTIEITSDGSNIAPSALAKDLTGTLKYTFVKATVLTDGSPVSVTNPGNTITAFNIYKRSADKYRVQYSTDADQKNWNYISDTTRIYLWYKSANQVTVTFNANGSSTAAPEKVTGNPGDVITLPDFGGTNGNTSFAGWAKVKAASSQYNELYKSGTKYTIPDSNVTLYAYWTSTKTGNFFIRNDNKIPYEPTQYNSALYSRGISIDAAVKENRWICASLNDNKGISGNYLSNAVTAALDASRMPSDDQIRSVCSSYDPSTQYVDWYVLKDVGTDCWHIDGVILNKGSVSIFYDGNKPEGSGAALVQNVPNGYQVDQGTHVKVGTDGAVNGALKSPTLTYYTFKGWNTKADGTGTMYAEGDDLRVDGNVTLYAQWSVADYKVIYDLNGGTKTSVSTEFDGLQYGTATPLISDPTRKDDAIAKNYKFIGWKDKDSESKELGVADTVTRNTTYVAQWKCDKIPYKVTYELEGGTSQTDPGKDIISYSQEYGTPITQIKVPEKTGYVFTMWTIGTSTEKADTTGNVTKDITFTAHWEPGTGTTFHVEHYLQNLSNPDTYVKQDGDEKYNGKTDSTVTAAAYVRSYTGFTYNPSYKESVSSGQIAADGSFTLKLYYSRNTYTVTYQYTGDVPSGASALPATASYLYGTEVTTASPATAANYTFSGWSRTGTFVITQDTVISGSFSYNGTSSGGGSSTASAETAAVTAAAADQTPAVLGARRNAAVLGASRNVTTADTEEQPAVLGAQRGRSTGDETHDGMRAILLLICAGSAGVLIWNSKKSRKQKHQ